jgi:DNA-directed RNA polymerase subunit RPC12/RpoP
MTIFLTILCGVATFFLGAVFWEAALSPSQLRHLLRNPAELERIIRLWGPQDILIQASKIQPHFFNSYSGNVAFLAGTFFSALRTGRNISGCLALGVAVGSYFLGPTAIAVTLGLFAIPIIWTLGPAKRRATKHLGEVALNLVKWQMEDPVACVQFCTMEFPVLSDFHKVLIGVIAGEGIFEHGEEYQQVEPKDHEQDSHKYPESNAPRNLVVCPSCGKQGTARDEYLGRRVKCKACGRPFVLVAASPENLLRVGGNVAIQRPSLPARFNCPSCGGHITPNENSGWSNVRCPTCGATVLVPSSAGS